MRVLRRDTGKSFVQQIQDGFFHLIGKNLQLLNSAYVTTSGHCYGRDLNKHPVQLEPVLEKNSTARNVTIIKDLEKNKIYHFCADDLGNHEFLFSYRQFVKVESESTTAKLYFPLFIQIPLVAILAVSSALFSGLNIGLMSLSVSSLELIIKHDERQRKYAQNILPLRKNGNLLLCTILIGNTFVNNCQTLLLSNLFNNLQLEAHLMMLLSIITPSAIIVVIGEILPQALCCRYGLIVGSKTRYITIFMIVVTFVVSYPMSKILDWLIGVEGPESFDKEMLTHIVEMNAEAGKGLSKATANLLVRALKYNEKVTVRRIMTPIEK
uniref:CNNM transmembrane domain-containing protein n=1 Tax=Panagrolaimus sp. JU765 TaxID=591449 RepID=A0AC34QRI3_9BILA